MLTLNQLKRKLTKLFESHKQIRTTVYSDNFSFSAERNLTYPVANIEFLESNIKDKELIRSYKIVLGDLIHPEKLESEDEIVSDMELIAEDFFASLQNDADVFLIKSSSLQKFSDSNGDRVSGITFRVNISLIRSQNPCAIPIKFF